MSAEQDVLWQDLRLVVFDTESTGLDPRKDKLISIGAIALEDEELCTEDTFEVLIPVKFNTSAVIIHGISREQSQKGIPEGEALRQFREYVGDAIPAGFHIHSDVNMLNAAFAQYGLESFEQPALETLHLLYLLEDLQKLPQHTVPGGYSLDAVAEFFGITTHDRHTAPGDAFITAQILMKLLRYARKAGLHALSDILQKPKDITEPNGAL